MFYTNDAVDFDSVLTRQLNSCTEVDIAVGFCGLDMVKKYRPKLEKIASRGRVRLILGMYRYDGALTKTLYTELCDLHRNLTAIAKANRIQGTGVRITQIDYHGKIYRLVCGQAARYYVGSNNFSGAGLSSRLEACTVPPQEDYPSIDQYIEWLADGSRSVTVDKLQFRNSAADPTQLSSISPIRTLPSHLTVIGTMRIKLRPSEQPVSSLNLSQGKGRLNKQSGTYSPRPWYEAEITTQPAERSNPLYPKVVAPKTIIKNGKIRHDNHFEFDAYLSDGVLYWPCKLYTYSDNSKALASSPRSVLGEFLKGRLEKAGVLRRGETITANTLAEYGTDYVTLTKMSDGSYVLTF